MIMTEDEDQNTADIGVSPPWVGQTLRLLTLKKITSPSQILSYTYGITKTLIVAKTKTKNAHRTNLILTKNYTIYGVIRIPAAALDDLLKLEDKLNTTL